MIEPTVDGLRHALRQAHLAEFRSGAIPPTVEQANTIIADRAVAVVGQWLAGLAQTMTDKTTVTTSRTLTDELQRVLDRHGTTSEAGLSAAVLTDLFTTAARHTRQR